MMATANLNLVHETEAQRRHARVKLPARLIVTDPQHNQYVLELSEISASGFSVVDDDAKLHLDHVYRGRLLFNFDSVEFVLKISFKVVNPNRRATLLVANFRIWVHRRFPPCGC